MSVRRAQQDISSAEFIGWLAHFEMDYEEATGKKMATGEDIRNMFLLYTQAHRQVKHG